MHKRESFTIGAITFALIGLLALTGCGQVVDYFDPDATVPNSTEVSFLLIDQEVDRLKDTNFDKDTLIAQLEVKVEKLETMQESMSTTIDTISAAATKAKLEHQQALSSAKERYASDLAQARSAGAGAKRVAKSQ